MFHPDIAFEGFTATDWSRMLALLGSVREPEPELSPPCSDSEDSSLATKPSEPPALTIEADSKPATSSLDDFFDAVCPSGRAMVIGVFEGGELWTSAALSRRAGMIDRIVGPASLREAMGLLSGDFRRDYRHLVQAVAERFGDLHFGCFAEKETFDALLEAPSPGAWARAVTVRDVIISPFPKAIALPLGLDAARASLSVMQSLAERAPLDGLRRLFIR